jgi:amino acid permease
MDAAFQNPHSDKGTEIVDYKHPDIIVEDPTSNPIEPTQSLEEGLEVAAGTQEYGGTKRGLSSRHAQMIALGGAIGTG